jgi:hypothetical protein
MRQAVVDGTILVLESHDSSKKRIGKEHGRVHGREQGVRSSRQGGRSGNSSGRMRVPQRELALSRSVSGSLSDNFSMYRYSRRPLRVIKRADMVLTTFAAGNYIG